MSDIFNKVIRVQFKAWGIFSGIALVFILLWAVGFGVDGFYRIIQEGPNSNAGQTLASVAMMWCGLGVLLGILAFRVRDSSSRLMWVGAFLIFTLYVNLCRENIYIGDAADYIKAAFELRSGDPLHQRYFYPPFLATLLQPLLFLGDQGIYLCLWCANLVAVPLCYILLQKLLKRYGFASNIATVLVFCAFIFNVPLMRTLYYTQINIWVLICILLSFLLFENKPIISALCLALAVQLKISPIVLIIPFLWGLNKRWLISFTFFNFLIIGATLILYGFSPFLSVLGNIGDVYTANGLCFREFSIDSFVASTGKAFDITVGTLVIKAVKTLVVSVVLILVARISYISLKNVSDKKSGFTQSLFPLILIFMVLASPLIWVHHLVFVIPAFLILTKKLRGVREFSIYGFAYFVCFMLPAFDFYPFSFVRLGTLFMLLYLFASVAGREDSEWIKKKLSVNLC